MGECGVFRPFFFGDTFPGGKYIFFNRMHGAKEFYVCVRHGQRAAGRSFSWRGKRARQASELLGRANPSHGRAHSSASTGGKCAISALFSTVLGSFFHFHRITRDIDSQPSFENALEARAV